MGHFAIGCNNVITFWSCGIDKYLYLQFSKATGATFIYVNAEINIDFFFQILCDNEIQQML